MAAPHRTVLHYEADHVRVEHIELTEWFCGACGRQWWTDKGKRPERCECGAGCEDAA